MAKSWITGRRGFLSRVYYYDERGRYVGKSCPGLIEGTRTFSDKNGRYVGTSRPGLLAKEVFCGRTDTVTTYGGFFGDVHFRNGVPVGTSRPGFLGSSHTVLEREEMAEDVGEEWEVEGEEVQAAPYRNPAHSILTFALCLGIFGLITGVYVLIHML